VIETDIHLGLKFLTNVLPNDFHVYFCRVILRQVVSFFVIRKINYIESYNVAMLPYIIILYKENIYTVSRDHPLQQSIL
jgi:hypothetical protein